MGLDYVAMAIRRNAVVIGTAAVAAVVNGSAKEVVVAFVHYASDLCAIPSRARRFSWAPTQFSAM
jgi:hypothetical protein